jgi:hypothetical protein
MAIIVISIGIKVEKLKCATILLHPALEQESTQTLSEV